MRRTRNIKLREQGGCWSAGDSHDRSVPIVAVFNAMGSLEVPHAVNTRTDEERFVRMLNYFPRTARFKYFGQQLLPADGQALCRNAARLKKRLEPPHSNGRGPPS